MLKIKSGIITAQIKTEKILNLIMRHIIELHSPSELTFIQTQSQYKPSITDLALTKNIPYVPHLMSIPYLSSDHYPVFFQVKIKIVTNKSATKFNFKKAN